MHFASRYAYVTNNGQGNISQYTVGIDGALAVMPNTVPAGSGPWSIITLGK